LSAYILVVDDEADVEHLFRQQFRRDIRAGRFIMEFASSAPEALERAKTIAEPMLILILSDINMPGMSRLEMLPKVTAARPNVPVIMITAYGDEPTKRKAAALGAAGLLTKPIDFGLLREEIDQRLAKGGIAFRADGGCVRFVCRGARQRYSRSLCLHSACNIELAASNFARASRLIAPRSSTCRNRCSGVGRTRTDVSL